MYRKLLHTTLAIVLSVLAGSSVPAWADGPGQRLVIFGDSLSDPGNYFIAFGQTSQPPFAPIPDAPYDRGGHHFTNGKTWAEQLARALDTPQSGGPALANPGEFTNYAVGRARARPNAPVFPAYDLSSQVGLFLADFHGRAPATATYIVWIGANDLDDALNMLASDPSGASSAAIVQAALGYLAYNIQALWSAGARTFLVPNIPDLGLTPAVRALGPVAGAAASQLSGLYNAALDQTLALLQTLPQTRIIRFDVNGLVHQVVGNPQAFGLGDVVDACLKFFTLEDPICEDPQEYLFWDGIHPTVTGHGILEDAARKLLALSKDN